MGLRKLFCFSLVALLILIPNATAGLQLPDVGDTFEIQVVYSTRSFQLKNNSDSAGAIAVVEEDNSFILKYTGFEKVDSIEPNQVSVIEKLVGNSTETTSINYFIRVGSQERIGNEEIVGDGKWQNETTKVPNITNVEGYPFPFPHDQKVFPSLYETYRAKTRMLNDGKDLDSFTDNSSNEFGVDRVIIWKGNENLIHPVDVVKEQLYAVQTEVISHENYSEEITIFQEYRSLEYYNQPNGILLYIEQYQIEKIQTALIPFDLDTIGNQTLNLEIRQSFESQRIVDASWFNLDQGSTSETDDHSKVQSNGERQMRINLRLVSVIIISMGILSKKKIARGMFP